MNARTFKLLGKFLFPAALALGYYSLPLFFTPPVLATKMGVSLPEIVKVSISSSEETVTARRNKTGEWRFGKHQELAADSDRIQLFLFLLASAPCSPASQLVGRTAPRVELTTADGEKFNLLLGKRTKLFRRQFVSVNGETYEVQADLASALGLFNLDGEVDRYALLDRALYRQEGRLGKAILTTPFSRYEVARFAGASSTTSPNMGDQAEGVTPWRARADGQPAKANDNGLHHWQKGVNTLEILKVSQATLWDNHPPLYTLRLSFDDDQEITLQASGGINKSEDRLIRLQDHNNYGTVLISANHYQSLFPAARNIIQDLPVFTLPFAEVTEVRAERDGHRFRLVRASPEAPWTLAEPSLPFPIFTPKVEGGMKPMSTVESFILALSSIQSHESFTLTDANAQKVEAAFSPTAARFTYLLTSGRSETVELSSEVPGTGKRFLRTEGRILVVAHSPLQLVPELRDFFDPEKVGDTPIVW